MSHNLSIIKPLFFVIELLKIAYQRIQSSHSFLLELEYLFLHLMSIYTKYFRKKFPRTSKLCIVERAVFSVSDKQISRQNHKIQPRTSFDLNNLNPINTGGWGEGG